MVAVVVNLYNRAYKHPEDDISHQGLLDVTCKTVANMIKGKFSSQPFLQGNWMFPALVVLS